MEGVRSFARGLDRPGTPQLRAAFGVLWLTDLVATLLLFLVPYAEELNPVTVLFYEAVGLPGVVLAGAAYALLVVAIGHLLSDPADDLFVVGVVALYAVFATNNVVLLAFRESIVETLVA